MHDNPQLQVFIETLYASTHFFNYLTDEAFEKNYLI